MQHLDEGTIHAWLDGALPPDEAQRAEAHTAACETCAAAVAEARGLIAASSRILGALDDVPSGVLPGRAPEADALSALRARRAAERAPRARRWWVDRRVAAAAGITFIAATATLVARQGGAPLRDAVLDTSERSPVVAPVPAPAPTPSAAAAREAASAPQVSARREADAAPPSAKPGVVPSESASSAERKASTGAAAVPQQMEAMRQAAPVPLPARQDVTAEQQAAARQAQATERREVATQAPAAPSAAALGAEAPRPAAPPDTRLALDSGAAADRARSALQRFANINALNAVVVPRADLAPGTLGREFVSVCYQLTPASPGTPSRLPLVPERIQLDSAIAGVEDGTAWFRARDLTGSPAIAEVRWRPQGDALVDLRVRLARPDTAAGEPASEVRLLASVPRAAAGDPAVGPPRAPFIAVPIRCPR